MLFWWGLFSKRQELGAGDRTQGKSEGCQCRVRGGGQGEEVVIRLLFKNIDRMSV